MMTSEGTTSGDTAQRGPFTTVNAENDIQEPKFNISVKVEWKREPALNFLERAADVDQQFRFTASYFGKELGYFINTINGLEGCPKKTYWRFTNLSGDSLDKGVSNYWPDPGEDIRFIFTRDEQGSHVCNNALASSWRGSKA